MSKRNNDKNLKPTGEGSQSLTAVGVAPYKQLRCLSCNKLLLKTNEIKPYELEAKCTRCGALNEFKSIKEPSS
ncbi:MAG: Com family DNA-binding transcriptional regulator [Cumulibacter sp.]